jgi:hypothetical protein
MAHPIRIALLASALLGVASQAAAQAIERVQPGDQNLDCAAIAAQSQALDATIAAGSGNAAGKAVAGGAANVGGQVAGAAVAQSLGGMFGALGGIVSKVAGSAAQQAATQAVEPDAATKQRATEAQARKAFLERLSAAKECSAGGSGKVIAAEQFQQLAAAAPAASGFTPVAMSAASIAPVLKEPVTLLPAADAFGDSNLVLKGKRFAIAEFRVLFDVGGQVTASTRGAYIPGRDYGSTRMRVTYKVPQLDIEAFQAITDAAYDDFKKRLAAAGVTVEDTEAFARENGAIYEAAQQASQPGAPVFLEKTIGTIERKYLVMAPKGMKLVSRGFAGMGAGNISKRMEWSRGNLEALSVSLAVNIANLESSGTGSSLFKRSSSASADEGMFITAAPDSHIVQSHAHTQIVSLKKAVEVGGGFARFREVGGYDSNTDATGRAVGILTNLAGMGANQTRRIDMEVDLDGPAMSRLSLQGLATVNQSVVDRIKAGM